MGQLTLKLGGDQLFMRFNGVNYIAFVELVEEAFSILPPIAWTGGGQKTPEFIADTDLVIERKQKTTEYIFRDRNGGGPLLYIKAQEQRIDTTGLYIEWTKTTARQAKTLVMDLCITTMTPVPDVLAAMPLLRMTTKRTLGEIEYLQPDNFPVAMIEPVKQNNKSPRSPREDQQIKTTAAHYAITEKEELQEVAAQLAGTSDKTYRTYRDKGWLLSGEAFKKLTGETLATYWTKTSGEA